MRRLFAMVGILAVGLVAPLAGEAADCVEQQKCADDQVPPACCQPPPCEMYEYLKMMRAVRRMTSGDRAEKALRESKGDHAKAIASLREAIGREWSTLKSQSKCRLGQGPFTAPNFRLTRGCDLEVQTPSGWSPVGQPLSLLRQFDSCNELLEAAFMQGSQFKELCRGAVPGNTGWWAARESAGARASIDTMMGHLQRYWIACSSPDLDDETRRQLEEAEVDMTTSRNPSLEEALRKLLQNPAATRGPRASRSQGR